MMMIMMITTIVPILFKVMATKNVTVTKTDDRISCRPFGRRLFDYYCPCPFVLTWKWCCRVT